MYEPKAQHEIDIFYSVTLLRVYVSSSCYYEGVGRGIDGCYHLFVDCSSMLRKFSANNSIYVINNLHVLYFIREVLLVCVMCV